MKIWPMKSSINISETEVNHLAGSAAELALLVVSCQGVAGGTGTLVSSSR